MPATGAQELAFQQSDEDYTSALSKGRKPSEGTPTHQCPYIYKKQTAVANSATVNQAIFKLYLQVGNQIQARVLYPLYVLSEGGSGAVPAKGGCPDRGGEINARYVSSAKEALVRLRITSVIWEARVP